MTKTEKQRIDFSDAKRFKAEYEAYFSALKYFAFRYIEDEEVVCDLLQDLFVKLWERGEMFENEMVLKAYLYRSVRNNCLTYIRDNRRREHRLAEYEPEETEEAFVDRIIEAESHQEISEELNIAINTIKKHKNNANHYLRVRLEKLLCFITWIG